LRLQVARSVMYILSVPAIYALELTSACNSRCPGCSNVYAAHRSGRPPLSAQEWRDLLSPFISEAVQIRLTGGEPTLHPEFSHIFEEVASHDAWVTVFTNGRWKDPKQFVKRIQGRRHFSGLLISLHGANATSHEAFSGVPGSFDETVANIRLAEENEITVALSTVITRYSCNELEAVVELGQELGVHHIAFNRFIGAPLPEIEPTEEQTQAAILRVQELAQVGAAVKYGIGVPQCFLSNGSEGCLAGVAYASIDPWGNLRPCAHSPTVVGSLRESSMTELWHSAAMEQWRALMPTDCISCAAYSVCHGGCRAIQELRPDRRDPLRHEPLDSFAPPVETRELPASGRPRAAVRLREEPFGYALLGRGQVMPVRPEARPVVEACTGEWTFAQLASRFDEAGLDLLGELWAAGMLDLV
jgi:radical SAM protein with 4Fe4S-binding SPASM domain